MEITELPTYNGGVKLVISDEDSDSLVIFEVMRSGGTLTAKTGLRGNYDATVATTKRPRPLNYTYATMRAPDVSPEERRRRKSALLRRMAGWV